VNRRGWKTDPPLPDRTFVKVSGKVRGRGGPLPDLPPPQAFILQPLSAAVRISIPVLLTLIALAAHPGRAQMREGNPEAEPSGWNGPEVRALIEAAREARRDLRGQAGPESYRALTEGHIYFYVDPEEGERALIRADQVAVELFWEAPDQVRQRIIGERAESRLPVRDFRYYLDRLTLVQYGFGDQIQVGQGLDVADVPHPLAPPGSGGEPDAEVYDFRLSDSLTVTLPGASEPLRIYEVEVRPRNSDQPGMVGSIHLSRSDAQLVRMNFTFTPASYVDRRNDRVSIELDYGLWEGAFWLPNRQVLEVRREIPELDIGVGTVIRAVLRVSGYAFGEPIPPELRYAPVVTALPLQARQQYPFQVGLLESMERDGVAGVATRVDPRELRDQAVRLLRNQPPSGLSPFRWHLPSLSSLGAFDRARGLSLGAGASFRPAGTRQVRGSAGWSFGSGQPRLEVTVEDGASGPWIVGGRVFLNAREDLGIVPAMAPVLGTAGALFLGEDYLDPWQTSGWSASLARGFEGGSQVRISLGVERHEEEALRIERAPWGGDRPFRAVLPIDPGWVSRGRVEWSDASLLDLGRGQTRARSWAEGLVGDEGLSVRWEGEGEWRWNSPDREQDAQFLLAGGVRWGKSLLQHRRLLGGRSTLPGFPYRSFAGDVHGRFQLTAATDLGSPLVRGRVSGAGGWIGGGDDERWGLPNSTHLRVGASAGVGLLFDLIRLDVARGLNGGEWQFLFSVDSRWWSWL